MFNEFDKVYGSLQELLPITRSYLAGLTQQAQQKT